MEDRPPSLIPETHSSPTSLDAEIVKVRQQIQNLASHRTALTAALLSSPSSQKLVARAKAQPKPSPHISTFENRMKEQEHQNVQNLCRMCAGGTMFIGRDPDPNAVDEGRIIGVRIEVFNRRTRTFRDPYYLLLNRPHPGSSSLCIHRHTIPQRVPIQHLVAKYLSSSNPSDSKSSESQNVTRLVRVLRRELISYHLRQEAIVALGEQKPLGADGGQPNTFKEVRAVDAEDRDLRIEWEDEIDGRIVVDNNGNLEKAVVANCERFRSREKNGI